MARTQPDKIKRHQPAIHRAQSGRIGQHPVLSKHRKYVNENKSKELFPDHAARSTQQQPPMHKLNLKQQRHKRIQDAIDKRLSVLQHAQNLSVVEDVRDEETISSTDVRLDNIAMSGTGRLRLGISCGFWGYTPSFSPIKVFELNVANFSHPLKLDKLVLNTQAFYQAGKQVGIDTKAPSIAVVGYEVLFPQGYRYKSSRYSDIKSGHAITYVPTKQRALINNASALRDFFQQARVCASDVYGYVSIPIVARLAMVSTNTNKGTREFVPFQPTWRSDEETKMKKEEKLLVLERQQFADFAESARIRSKAQEIEARASLAEIYAAQQRDALGAAETVQVGNEVHDAVQAESETENSAMVENDLSWQDMEIDFDL